MNIDNKKNYFLSKVRNKFFLGYSKRSGCNFFGRKTVYTQSGGVKAKLSLIDFKRNILLNGLILTIEKDYFRTSFISLICYSNGLFSYILLSSKLNLYEMIDGFNFKSNLKKNAPMFLYNITVGSLIHHVEIKPLFGAKLCRAAGLSCVIVTKTNNFCYLKMNSG
jgi:large subunit ribosomal protein L2